jgi:hypothetical protein
MLPTTNAPIGRHLQGLDELDQQLTDLPEMPLGASLDKDP